MNSKKRVLKAINKEGPDRVPLDLEIRGEVLEQLRRCTGSETSEEAYRLLGIDIRRVEVRPGEEFLKKGAFLHPRRKWVIEKSLGVYEDEWGIQYRTDKDNRYFGFCYHPLMGATSLANYEFPDISDSTRFKEVDREIAEFAEEYAVMGIATLSFFEQAWQLRGYNRFIVDMYDNCSFVEELLDKLLEFRKIQCRKYVELGVDIVHLGDDFGMQDRMMISPDLWREHFKPRMKELISNYSTGHEVFTMYHSDGYIEPIIDDLIEIGVDILNPIQPESMNPCEIKKNYGDRITLHGTISVQTTLPHGSREEVEKKVREIIKCCAPGGGLILAPTHAIQMDTPTENILTFYDVAREFGKYPLKV